MMGTYRFAGMTVRVESLYADVHDLCHEYRSSGEPNFAVHTTQGDIDFERKRSDAADATAERTPNDYTDAYLETLAVYRKIAEAMPAHGVVLVHGSCVAVNVSYTYWPATEDVAALSKEGMLAAVAGISIEVHKHEFVALAGHGGCGKSTALRLLMGAHRPDAGEVYLHLEDGSD
ncbi:MAG: ATP-binding cassette domain-containing protein [Atopobiaceae bacterium]|nr:ATP-binding cassette domain-containing protein [Atopobiaceae bacterium]